MSAKLHSNKNSKLKAIGCFIFGGSQTIGHLKTGWNVDRILEMTDDMKELNSAHFVRNYPDIPVILPSEWNSEGYLDLLKGKYDFLFANNPCSGLSQINPNASADSKANCHFYEVFDVIKTIEPKIFLMENAPTLISLGMPILKKMADIISDDYRFTIIHDMAGNHGVCMKRMRTFIIGWNRKYFDKIPLINMNKETPVTLNGIINKPLDGVANCEPDKKRLWYNDAVSLYKYVKPHETVIRACLRLYDNIKQDFSERWLKEIDHTIAKIKRKGGMNIWDKSPKRPDGNGFAPSLTSLTFIIHPTEDRELYVREYARIMGYPDEFIFYPNESKIPCVQACAQGVPVNFIKYISSEIRRIFENKDVEYAGDSDKDIVFQNHIAKKYCPFTLDEFKAIDGNLTVSCPKEKLTDLLK